MRKQPPCHLFPNLQYGIIRQSDISIHIDQFSLFHAVIGASSHVAVLNHFIVCNTQFSESSYQKIAQAIALRLEVSIVFQILRKKSKELSYTAIGRHIYKQLKMCKQYAKEMATLQ